MSKTKKGSFWAAGLAVAAGLALSLAPAAQAQSLGVGKAAPAFSLKTVEGKTVDTQKFRDKRAQLLVFWASW